LDTLKPTKNQSQDGARKWLCSTKLSYIKKKLSIQTKSLEELTPGRLSSTCVKFSRK